MTFSLATEGAGYLSPGAGTAFYAAPEVMERIDSSKAGRSKARSRDIWTLGMSALRLAVLEVPKYPSLPEDPASDDRSRAHQEWILNIVSHLQRFPAGNITTDFIRTMLQESWRNRPSATDCIKAKEYFSAAPGDVERSLWEIRGASAST